MRTILILLVAAAAGCGTDDTVWSSSVSQLVLRSSGGFAPISQPTADCPESSNEYTFVVASAALTAARCTPAPAAPHPLVLTTVSRTLGAPERDELIGKLEALRVVSADTCGADKPAVTVRVTRPSGTTEYADSFYACNHDDPRPTIDSDTLDAAAQAFSLLAFPSP